MQNRHNQPCGRNVSPWRTLLAGAALAVVLPVSGGAADTLPQPADFTFKRIMVPQSFEGRRRINVQIDPVAQAAALAAPTGHRRETSLEELSDTSINSRLPRSTAPGLPFTWFWAGISPALDASAPNRLEVAEQLLNNPPNGNSMNFPRMQNLQAVAERYGRDILGATVGTRVSPALVLAVIGVESAGRVDAVSSAGASGLMQLMPATAERFGVTDRSDPVQNIKGGVAYLDWLMKEFNYDPILVLAAYNAGENAVRRNGGVPEYAETRGYVPKVIAAWTVARGLCTTPPELATDGCVFYVNLAGNDG